jgi:hypothetical protein
MWRGIKVFIWILAIVIIGSSVSSFAIPKVFDKFANLTYRLRLLEERSQSFGAYLAADIENYQASRGSPPGIASSIPNTDDLKWQKIDVPWDEAKFIKTKALAVYQGNLVVGLLGERSTAVYLFDGESWRLLGDNRISGWEKFNYVQTLTVHDERLYAGINNEVWAYDDTNDTWTKAGGAFPWTDGTAYSLRTHNGSFYLAVMGKKPSIYKLQNDEWHAVIRGLDAFDGDGIYDLWSHSDGNLYASLAATTGSTVIFRLNPKTETWEPIGGKGINGSWTSGGFKYGLSMASHQNFLIVTANRHPQIPGNFSSIWAFDGTQWFPVGAEGAPQIWGEMNNFNASISINGNLIVGGGGHPAGNASIWLYRKHGWELIGGFGVNSSWGPNFPHTLTDSFRSTAAEYPYRLIEWNGDVIAGFGDALGAAQVWRLPLR